MVQISSGGFLPLLIWTSYFRLGQEQIEIRCPTHGWFTQLVTVHQSGSGCKLCGHTNIQKTVREHFDDCTSVPKDWVVMTRHCESAGEFWYRHGTNARDNAISSGAGGARVLDRDAAV
jgi:hypothetical protein